MGKKRIELDGFVVNNGDGLQLIVPALESVLRGHDDGDKLKVIIED